VPSTCLLSAGNGDSAALFEAARSDGINGVGQDVKDGKRQNAKSRECPAGGSGRGQ
jgi:hypothetical protein